MNRQCVAAGILLSCMAMAAHAVDITWFEQHAPGSAGGELRLARPGDGELEVRTPGHDLEIGVMRYGDHAVVTLSSRRPRLQVLPAAGQTGPETLMVTVRQGDAAARAAFSIVPAPPEEAREAVPEATVVTAGTHSRSPVEGEPRPAPASRGTAPVVPPRVEEVSHAGDSAGMNPPGEPAAPPPDDTCPVLTVRPGSLRNNVTRLLHECGAGMGEWVTWGGHVGVYTDWVVHDPEVLAEHNTRGLAGLLEQLQDHYGLKGVRHPRLPHTIDVYKIPREAEEQ